MRFAAALCASAILLSAANATLDGNRIWYEVNGTSGTALVLVHGWTCDSTFWSHQVPAFSRHFRVLSVDLPGHGRSGKPDVRYDLSLFSRGVLAAMDAAKIDRAILIGHSMGLPVIRQVSLTHPHA